MKTLLRIDILLDCFAFMLVCLFLIMGQKVVAGPTVSNIAVSQRADGSGLVDVSYDLSGGTEPMLVSVVFSSDSGATWNVYPNNGSLSGDAGPGISNGTGKHIVWNALRDRPEVYWPQAKVRVTAFEPGSEQITLMLPGDVPLVMCRIPAGSFQMGSPDTERSRSTNEGPVHTVTIGDDFFMGKYEVTQQQWLAVMGSWPGTEPSVAYGLGDDYPAYYISWNDIAGTGGFIQKLNEHLWATGQAPNGVAAVRLPSEAEWEYACRAGTTTRFFFGDSLGGDDGLFDAPAGTLPGNRTDYMWFGANNSPGGTKPMSLTKLPNAFLLCGMHGNVSEWCADYYHVNYSGAPADGSAWVIPGTSSNVTRGGQWRDSAYICRSANRTPTVGSGYLIGFRLARTQ